ncbi:MAG: chloride channel protein [Lachnospiraceae bacterium]|nr:chloride channel protein [Lachnospiraceae bacterium]
MNLNHFKKEQLKSTVSDGIRHFKIFLKWTVLSLFIGVIVGFFSSTFGVCMEWANEMRAKHDFLLLFLPIGGLFIIWIYHYFHFDKDSGTNRILDTVHSKNTIPFRMAPLIFISTVITHLFGGSAGREGAALQIGGSFGDKIGRVLKLDEMDRKVMVMCGMSAAFSALFGTSMAAAIFPLEVITVGVMYYVALLPCVISSLVASFFANEFGISPESFHILKIPAISVESIWKIALLALICAFVSSIFCTILHTTADLYAKYLPNPYIRVVVAGCFITALSFLLGTRDYNGAGIDVIKRAFLGDVVPYAFLLKMIFTALTLGAGYRGGEIVPSFFVGATLGCLFGNIFSISPSFCAALGMASVFCGVTNCPITTLLISFELFGFAGTRYFILAIAISYMLSGYSGLYHEQKIMYSKYKARFINMNTKDLI